MNIDRDYLSDVEAGTEERANNKTYEVKFVNFLTGRCLAID